MRPLHILYFSLLLIGLCWLTVQSADNNKTNPNNDITPGLENAVAKGLAFLASRQSANGSWGNQYSLFTTSLGSLAFMAGGNLPGEGKYGDVLKNSLRYTLKCTTKVGYITEFTNSKTDSRMHGHGMATMFLAELYGMMHDTSVVDQDELKSIIKKAIRLIGDCQSKEGGWYYEPQNCGDEGSVTVCIVQALRAARNAGIAVDKNVIDNGVKYLQRSANPDGSFKYRVQDGGGGTFALTAGGVSSLCLYGLYDAPETKRGFDFLMRFKPGRPENWHQGYPYYANFYGTLAMHLGNTRYWNDWFPALREFLIKVQMPNGAWAGEIDEYYATAFACLMLQMPYQYLPLFQK